MIMLFGSLLLVILSLSPAHASPLLHQMPELLSKIGVGFTGANTSEAIFTFDHFVEFQSSIEPDEALAAQKINQQLLYLVGPMAASADKAAPKMDHVLTNIRISSRPGLPGVYMASYSYRGTIAVMNSAQDLYSVYLPLNPDRIYRQAKKAGSGASPCGNRWHPEAEYLWLYFNPLKKGCELKQGTHFHRVQGVLERLPVSTDSYPDYARLADPDGTIRIDVYMGMGKNKNFRNPGYSIDVNAANYRMVRKQLKNMGFEKATWESEKTRDFLEARGFPSLKKVWNLRAKTGYVEEFTRPLTKGKIVVRTFFGPTDDGFAGRAFHYFLKDSLENAAIVFYAGHSGVGKYLDIDAIEQKENFKIKLPMDRYQLLFMNGCTTYSYYNDKFFNRKKTAEDSSGTKNLDILTNGLSTIFGVNDEAALATIKAVQDWAEKGVSKSYQQLAKEIDSKNLFGVNGD